MGRVGCIDIGTVTCRLAVADVSDGRVQRLHKRSTIVDLGENLTTTGNICDAARERLLTCIDGYLAEARAMEVPVICCTLTSAARDAENSDELLADLADRGLDAQVIPGVVEGSLTLLGVCQDFPGQLVLVADNGDRRYGRCDDKIWLLSCDDYRKYRETILANCDFEDDWWWTLTPWWIDEDGSGYFVRSIYPSGSVYSYNLASNSYGVAPACIFHLASLASAPSGADLIIQLQANVEELKRQIRQIKQTLKEMEED